MTDGSATRVLDVGTGGGFPGLPLAIACPGADFTLADGRGKKIQVVTACAKAANAANVRAVHGRVPEDVAVQAFDFVLGRAVTALPGFVASVAPSMRLGNATDRDRFANGILYVKGGDFGDELRELGLQPKGIYCVENLLRTDRHETISSDKRILYFTTADVLSRSPRPGRRLRLPSS